jgi:hypothetical protein
MEATGTRRLRKAHAQGTHWRTLRYSLFSRFRLDIPRSLSNFTYSPDWASLLDGEELVLI